MFADVVPSVVLSLCLCSQSPPHVGSSTSRGAKPVLLVLDDLKGTNAGVLNACAAKLKEQYEQAGAIVLMVGKESVERWIVRGAPRFSDSVFWLKASVFAESHGVQGLTFLGSCDPAKPAWMPTMLDRASVAQGPTRERLSGISILEINLEACSYPGDRGYYCRDADEFSVVPYCSWFVFRGDGEGALERGPQFVPHLDHSKELKGRIGRMLGIALRGCRIAAAGPRSVGYRDGLRTGDRIVAIDGRAVTDQTVWPSLAHCSPEAVRFSVERGTETIEMVARPIEFLPEWLAPFHCLGKRITELSADQRVNQVRGRWFSDLDAKRRVILLTCWADQPGPWIATLNLVAEKFKQDGLCWLAVSSHADESAWRKFTSDNPTLAAQARDLSLAKDLAVEELPCHFILDADGMILYSALASNEVPAIVAGLLNEDNKPPRAGGRQP